MSPRPAFSPQVHYMSEVDSTNARLKELARSGSGEGTAVLAEAQTHGRGRAQRLWHSPRGGMYLSVLLCPTSVKRFPDLAILAGVCLAQAVKQSLPKSHDVSLKWPNDCLIGKKKVGGVLCEKISDTFAVVGMGLNINLDSGALSPYQNQPFPATSFREESGGGTFVIEEVVETVLAKLGSLYDTYRGQGFGPIRYLWEKNCSFIGKKVEIQDSGWSPAGAPPDRGNPSGPKVVGTFMGLDDSGALILGEESDPGSGTVGTRYLFSGEIVCCWL